MTLFPIHLFSELAGLVVCSFHGIEGFGCMFARFMVILGILPCGNSGLPGFSSVGTNETAMGRSNMPRSTPTLLYSPCIGFPALPLGISEI